MPRPSCDREQVLHEPAMQFDRAKLALTASLPNECGLRELPPPLTGCWHDPQILDWDQMTMSNLSNIHLL
jgi:hypothetical protein